MYALALEDKEFAVERKLNLGSKPVAQVGLESAQIDLISRIHGHSSVDSTEITYKW